MVIPMVDGVIVKSRFPMPLLKIVDLVRDRFGISRAQAIKFLTILGVRLYNIGLTERALRLYEEGKASVGKAAEIAGMPIDSFVYVASAKGIRSNIKESIKGLIDALKTER